MKYKSARSRATDIPKEVKQKVLERDGCCIICGKRGMPNAHYISRQRGGLGIEENICTLCTECHYQYDFGDKKTQESIRYVLKEYLTKHYPNFNENNLIYKRWDF